MIREHLGETQSTYMAGGRDLIFPHHENEIAQSRCAHGGDYVQVLDAQRLPVDIDGEKMSKSLGNFRTVRDLLRALPRRGAALCATCQRTIARHLNFSVELLDRAQGHAGQLLQYAPRRADM